MSHSWLMAEALICCSRVDSEWRVGCEPPSRLDEFGNHRHIDADKNPGQCTMSPVPSMYEELCVRVVASISGYNKTVISDERCFYPALKG